MKIALCASVILLALVGTVNLHRAAAAHSDGQSDEKELVRLTHDWIDAINAKDQAKLDRLMAPTFVFHSWDGNRPDTARETWLNNLFHVIDIEVYSHSAIRAQVFGDVAAVTSNWYWRGVSGTTEKKPFESHGYCLDMWRRTGGRWQVVSRTSVVLPGKEPAHSE